MLSDFVFCLALLAFLAAAWQLAEAPSIEFRHLIPIALAFVGMYFALLQ